MRIKMLNNLKFQLTKFPKALAFGIEAQTEEWREKSEYTHETLLWYKCKNGINIYSHGECTLDYIKGGQYSDEKRLYIIGAYNVGNKVIINRGFNSNTQRDKYYNLIIEALKQWSLHVYKLRGVEPQEPKQEGDRYVF